MIPREVLLEAEPEDMADLEQLLRERRGAAVTLHAPTARRESAGWWISAGKTHEDVLLKHQQNKQIKFRRTALAMQELAEGLRLPCPCCPSASRVTISPTPRAISRSDRWSCSSRACPTRSSTGISASRPWRAPTTSPPWRRYCAAADARAGGNQGTRRQRTLPVDEGRFSHLPDLMIDRRRPAAARLRAARDA